MTKSGTATASVNGTVVAETSTWEEVDGNVYFPRAALHDGYFSSTDHHTTCPWKGQANYYTITVDGTTLENAAWTYETPKDGAAEIKEHVAFYKTKVDVEAK